VCAMGQVPQLMSVLRQPWVSAGICLVVIVVTVSVGVTWEGGRVYKVTGGLLV
jgi:hypothetical protein